MAFREYHIVWHHSLDLLHLAIAVILVLMAMAELFAFLAIRTLLLTVEVTVLLQAMPKEVWYGLWLFS
jgi:hypothetical protein